MTLESKLKQAKRIIHKYLKQDNVSIFWSGGKDSTLMLYLIKECLGYRAWPPIILLDSGDEFPEVLEFINEVEQKWKFKVKKFKYSIGKNAREARENKATLVGRVIQKLKLKYVFIGIRATEHRARAESKIISQRKGHVRIHPIFPITEQELWRYIKKNKVPYCGLYDQGYTSLGEKKYTKKVVGGYERDSRQYQEGEVNMESYKEFKRLKELGYFV